MIDTSRVALALVRQRLMAARHPSYLLHDSPEGARKEAQLTGKLSNNGPFRHSVRRVIESRESEVYCGQRGN